MENDEHTPNTEGAAAPRWPTVIVQGEPMAVVLHPSAAYEAAGLLSSSAPVSYLFVCLLFGFFFLFLVHL